MRKLPSKFFMTHCLIRTGKMGNDPEDKPKEKRTLAAQVPGVVLSWVRWPAEAELG